MTLYRPSLNLVSTSSAETSSAETSSAEIVHEKCKPNVIIFHPTDSSLLAAGYGWDLAHNTLVLWDINNGKEKWMSTPNKMQVYLGCFDPRGTIIVTFSDREQTMVVSRVGDGRVVGKVGTWGNIKFLDCSESRIAAVHDDGTLSIYDRERLDLVATLNWDNPHMRFCFSPLDESILFAWQISGGFVECWDVDTEQKIFSFKEHDCCVLFLHVCRDGRSLITVSTDATVCYFDWLEGNLLRTFTFSDHCQSFVRSAAFTNDERYLVVTCWSANWLVLDLESGTVVQSYAGQDITTCVVSSNGQHIAFDRSYGIRVYSIPSTSFSLDACLVVSCESGQVSLR